MATVAETIRAALRTIGVLAASETPSASDQSDALVTLNDMLDSWANERLTLYATQRNEYDLVPSASPQTLGPLGLIDDTRPVRIERASFISATNASNEIPLALISDAEYQAVHNKTATGIPSSLWISTLYPLMSLYLWPIPVTSGDTLALYMWLQIGRFASATSSVDLPPGYARALRFNLAVELAPEYGVQVTPDVANLANEAKASLKRMNHQTSYLRCDPAMLQAGPLNIVSGDR